MKHSCNFVTYNYLQYTRQKRFHLQIILFVELGQLSPIRGFLPAAWQCHQPLVPLPCHQTVLWHRRAGKHRPGSVLQNLHGGLPEQPELRPGSIFLKNTISVYFWFLYEKIWKDLDIIINN